MGEALEKMLAGQASDSRLIRVVLSPSDEDLDQCDVVYVATSSTRKVHETLDRLRNKSVLTVGDTSLSPKVASRTGGTAQQVQMIINLDAVERGG